MQRRCLDKETLDEGASGDIDQFTRQLPRVLTHVNDIPRLKFEIRLGTGKNSARIDYKRLRMIERSTNDQDPALERPGLVAAARGKYFHSRWPVIVIYD